MDNQVKDWMRDQIKSYPDIYITYATSVNGTVKTTILAEDYIYTNEVCDDPNCDGDCELCQPIYDAAVDIADEYEE